MAFFLKDAVTNDPNASALEQWKRVDVPTQDLPQTGAYDLFTVSGGRVFVKMLLGQVTEVIETQTNNLSIRFTPVGGSVADIASDLDSSADAAGTHYHVEGDGTALIATTTVQFAKVPVGALGGFIVGPGTIDLEASASNTGQVRWTLWYLPLDPGAKVVRA